MNYFFNQKLFFNATLCGLFLLFLIQACSQNPVQSPGPLKPNIVFIFADDMGYGDISGLNAQSKIRTPAIDALIQDGIIFTNAHASASVCTPSRY
uniref:sulfatase-like hydrolase/transferase n=1 Tax=Aquiflexum sp. TaxID=1872584 RepID=UPI00359455DE